MENIDLRLFRQVWVVDTEYRQVDGGQLDVHCLVAGELWSGRVLRVWYDELFKLDYPPYPIGPGSLFVTYNALAELGAHLSLGWELPVRVVDLLVEFRWLTNGTGWRAAEKSKHKLVHAVQYFGLNPMDAIEKSEMQALAMRGKPFSADERQALLDYCANDVVVTTELLRRMAPCITIQALQRGRFARTAAHMLHDGIPIDQPTHDRLCGRREHIIQALIEDVNPTFDVYHGVEFRQEKMQALVARHNLAWPRLPSGCLSMKGHDWEQMAQRYEFLQPLHACRQTKDLLRKSSLAVGPDGRNRYGFFPFAADTGRNTWKAREFIFAQPSFLRGLIQPPPGKGLAYVDYGSQEFAVAAVLANDQQMQEAYLSSDPYLTFGKQACLIPASATKESHAPERKKLKACVLGLQYLITEWGLSKQLDLQIDYAAALIAAHRRVYGRFWQWVDAVIDRALIDGFQETLLGWRTVIRDGDCFRNGKPARLFNPRKVVNFPVQGGSADITRLACNMASERGITVLANIHDALLVESDEHSIDEVADEVSDIMVEAGCQLLNGFTLKVDRKVIKHPQRLLSDESDYARWTWLMGRLNS